MAEKRYIMRVRGRVCVGAGAFLLFACACMAGVVSVFCSCKDTASEQAVNYTDTLVYYDSHMQIYVCEHEWSGIVLSEKDPNKVVANTKWHVPTYTEAVLVRSCRFGKECGTQRYLCYDTDFGVWYSYKMNNEGNVTKAGNKTKYAIRPVRVVTIPNDTTILL